MPHAKRPTVFLFLSAFVGLLVSAILAFVNTVQRHANHLLSMSLHYLVAPCAYLYVRSVLHEEIRFHRFDWLYFVPFGPHTLALLPFLPHSAACKFHYLQLLLVDMAGVTKQQEGLLPACYQPVLKFGLGTAYGRLQGRRLWRFGRQAPAARRTPPRKRGPAALAARVYTAQPAPLSARAAGQAAAAGWHLRSHFRRFGAG